MVIGWHAGHVAVGRYGAPVVILAIATFASGFATPAPRWPRRGSRCGSLGWHHVALVMVVGLAAGGGTQLLTCAWEGGR